MWLRRPRNPLPSGSIRCRRHVARRRPKMRSYTATGPHAAVVCITVEAGCVSTTRRLKNPTRASTFVRALVKGGWVPYMLLAGAALVSPFLQLMAGVVLRRRACSRPRCSSSGKRRKRSGGGGRRRRK